MSILKPFLTTLLFSIAVCSHAQIITTYAGNEHGYGYNGDGGPATAAKFGTIYTCATDTLGNLFIADMGVNNRIRKVNSSGIVTTVAGNGTYTHSGDSGAATSTGISFAYCVAVDNLENIYIGEGDVSSGLIINSWIRKITPTGVITTIAGNGVGGFSGDNGPA
ncbi:MAG: repeat containing protein, partial [Flavipsychrobacter sp.]|nr:repeat containing protein [Flavipsychrobacter sp.]